MKQPMQKSTHSAGLGRTPAANHPPPTHSFTPPPPAPRPDAPEPPPPAPANGPRPVSDKDKQALPPKAPAPRR